MNTDRSFDGVAALAGHAVRTRLWAFGLNVVRLDEEMR